MGGQKSRTSASTLGKQQTLQHSAAVALCSSWTGIPDSRDCLTHDATGSPTNFCSDQEPTGLLHPPKLHRLQPTTAARHNAPTLAHAWMTACTGKKRYRLERGPVLLPNPTEPGTLTRHNKVHTFGPIAQWWQRDLPLGRDPSHTTLSHHSHMGPQTRGWEGGNNQLQPAVFTLLQTLLARTGQECSAQVQEGVRAAGPSASKPTGGLPSPNRHGSCMFHHVPAFGRKPIPPQCDPTLSGNAHFVKLSNG